ncbi:MAG: BrnA antitoxin family protein [Fibromonadales bacterium]|nr:BrnA antitoxin family protein [Fibromonadales bacterium]
MTRLMKSIASGTRGMLKCGVKVSFTEAELKEMGIKVPKSKLHLVKRPQATAIDTVSMQLPRPLIVTIKRQAKQASMPWTSYMREVLEAGVNRMARV